MEKDVKKEKTTPVVEVKETPCVSCGENKRLTQEGINKIIDDRRKAVNDGKKINK